MADEVKLDERGLEAACIYSVETMGKYTSPRQVIEGIIRAYLTHTLGQEKEGWRPVPHIRERQEGVAPWDGRRVLLWSRLYPQTPTVSRWIEANMGAGWEGYYITPDLWHPLPGLPAPPPSMEKKP